jgi:hypothetical protein
MTVTVDMKARKLLIELPIDPHPSKSGKTTIVATTSGNQPTTATYDGRVITVGANAYVK